MDKHNDWLYNVLKKKILENLRSEVEKP